MPTNPFEYLWPGIAAAQAIYVDEKMHHRGHGDHRGNTSALLCELCALCGEVLLRGRIATMLTSLIGCFWTGIMPERTGRRGLLVLGALVMCGGAAVAAKPQGSPRNPSTNPFFDPWKVCLARFPGGAVA